MKILKEKYSLIAALLTAMIFFTGYDNKSPKNHLAKEAVKSPIKYNILFIAVDDLRPELGCYGVKAMHSPNIDQLAAEGLLFERAYCQQALCSPSRTSLLTGLRPDATRVYDLVTHFRVNRPEIVTLPQHFKNNGYYTAAIAKIFHNTQDDKPSWSQPTIWFDDKDVRGYVSEENIKIARANTVIKGLGPSTEGSDLPDSLHQDYKNATQSIKMLTEVKNKPFFLAVGFAKPHLPFIAPKKYWDIYQRSQFKIPYNKNPQGAPDFAMHYSGELRKFTDIPKSGDIPEAKALELIHGYYASTTFVDAQIGRVLQELKDLGLDKNTIVVFWGDHGFKLGDFGQWSKLTNYEIDTRSPLIIRAPNITLKGKKTKALVEFVDIYPSLCELAGLPLPKHLQGSSFTSLLNSPNQKGKSVALSQHPREKGIMGYSMRTDRYRFTSWQKQDNWKDEAVAIELYDHKKDPGEKVNLAILPSYAKMIKGLSIQLKREWFISLNSN